MAEEHLVFIRKLSRFLQMNSDYPDIREVLKKKLSKLMSAQKQAEILKEKMLNDGNIVLIQPPNLYQMGIPTQEEKPIQKEEINPLFKSELWQEKKNQ